MDNRRVNPLTVESSQPKTPAQTVLIAKADLPFPESGPLSFLKQYISPGDTYSWYGSTDAEDFLNLSEAASRMH